MTTLDKYLLRNFLFAYLAIFACLVLMYVVIDVFTKFEEFTVPDSSRIARKAQRAQVLDTTGQNYTAEAEKCIAAETNAWQRIRSFCKNVTVFYAYRLPVFFQRVNGIMLLLAGAFTIGLMERQNELIPILSSGVPLWRLLIPLGCMSSIFLTIQVLDTEMVIPHCADHLLRQAEDPMGKRPLLVPGTFDDKHVHVDARVAYPQRQMIQHARVTLPASLVGNTVHIRSKEMFYHRGTGTHDHGWIMNGCDTETVPVKHPVLKQMGPNQFFLHTDLTYARVTRRPNWYLYQSTCDLLQVIEQEQGVAHRSAIISLLHQRFLAPCYDLLLLILGLPIIAGRSEWNLYVRVGWCLLIFSFLQGLSMTTAALVKTDSIDPTLAAWLPLLLLGPLVPATLVSMRT